MPIILYLKCLFQQRVSVSQASMKLDRIMVLKIGIRYIVNTTQRLGSSLHVNVSSRVISKVMSRVDPSYTVTSDKYHLRQYTHL